MSKIFDIIVEELEHLQLLNQDLLNQKHSLELEMEAVDDVIKKLRSQVDVTAEVFRITPALSTPEDKEIDTLLNKKSELHQEVEQLTIQMNCNTEKMQRIQSAIEDEDVIHNGYQILNILERDCQRTAQKLQQSIALQTHAALHKIDFIMQIADSDMQRAKLELKKLYKNFMKLDTGLEEIVTNLMPVDFAEKSFSETVKEICSALSKKNKKKIVFSIDSAIDTAPIENIVFVTLVRIVNELLTNSTLRMCIDMPQLVVKLEDNEILMTYQEYVAISAEVEMQTDSLKGGEQGKVHEPEQEQENIMSVDLDFLKERVNLLNGSLQCECKDEIRIVIVIPISKKDKEIVSRETFL